MPASTASLQNPASAGGPARKRRRSREPDWNAFYKNGLPKEVIVIDDTPEPDADADLKEAASNYSTGTYTNGTVNGSDAGRPVNKKRRKDDVYQNGRRATNGSQMATPTSTSTSTDRTSSAQNTTTAATSLGSLSSNGHYDYEPPQTGQKRKRTRQQIAQEAKRREVEVLSERFATYKPPTKPVKKSGEVAVRVVNDVSCPVCLLSYSC